MMRCVLVALFTPPQYEAHLRAELAKYACIVKAAGIKAE